MPPDEMERARTDLGWAYELAMTERDGNSERWTSTDKAWNGLISCSPAPLRSLLVLGAESFVELPDVEPDSDGMFDFQEDLEDDWGCGPPSYLTPVQVAAAASQLERSKSAAGPCAGVMALLNSARALGGQNSGYRVPGIA